MRYVIVPKICLEYVDAWLICSETERRIPGLWWQWVLLRNNPFPTMWVSVRITHVWPGKDRYFLLPKSSCSQIRTYAPPCSFFFAESRFKAMDSKRWCLYWTVGNEKVDIPGKWIKMQRHLRGGVLSGPMRLFLSRRLVIHYVELIVSWTCMCKFYAIERIPNACHLSGFMRDSRPFCFRSILSRFELLVTDTEGTICLLRHVPR